MPCPTRSSSASGRDGSKSDRVDRMNVREFGMLRSILGLCALPLLCCSADNWSDYDVKPVPEYFSEGSSAMPPSRNVGDIVFYPNPAPSSLSPAERFMIFGAEKGDGSRV